MRCEVSVTPLMDQTGERAVPCGSWSVGECIDCSTSVCTEHGHFCACGEIVCQSCRLEHEVDCEDFKLGQYQSIRKYAETRA